MKRKSLCLLSLALLFPACGDETDAEATGAETEPLCREPVAVPCEDEAFELLSLNEIEPSSATVTTTDFGGLFTSNIDATAGGFGAQPQGAYVYARFTDTGLEKVDLSDTEALASMDWDIAFQRYRIRLNSGTSGPSCVAAARLPADVDFGGLSEIPSEATFREENFFTASCEPITDGGLGGPQLVLGGYYNYTSCLQMNGAVYAIQLANGRTVKLTVSSYYEASAQQECDEDAATFAPIGSANFVVNWGFLD